MLHSLPDVACAKFLGDRILQQDAVNGFNHRATGITLMGLSDGLGGPGNGDLASEIILGSAFRYLLSHISEIAADFDKVIDVLQGAAFAANRQLATEIANNDDLTGMGGTLLLAVVLKEKFRWLSIGDSLVLHNRAGEMTRLNKLHSLADGLDKLVEEGKIDSKTAQSMAARSPLTSALVGQKLKKIDAPVEGITLKENDAVLLTSDGIETLTSKEIGNILDTAFEIGAARTAFKLVDQIETKGVEGQDNFSACVCVT